MTPAALFAGGLAAGLVAGTASCTAVQGGLLIGLTGRRDGGRPGSGLAVVPAFIGGRLASHAMVGALLGLLGGVVRIPPEGRAVLLVGAGTAVICFAARLIRNTGRTPACSSHHAPSALSSPSTSAPPPSASSSGPPGTPAPSGTPSPSGVPAAVAGVLARVPPWMRAVLLGAVTILIPCGVTLSTEVIAVSSGSWFGGAAVMAGFVTGTAPAFALLGVLLRRIATTRLAIVAAAAALVAGSVTVVAGLRLGGWLPDLGAPPTATAGAQTRADGTQVVTVWSTAEGYRPGVVSIEAGRPAEIVFRTLDNQGCTRTLTIQGHDITLPVTGEATVRLAPQGPGRLRYVCGMGMYAGFINVSQPASPGAATEPRR
ncbi:sulfite exporter TauE/SafE family protein [Sphaerisporangium sp. NPDC049003]|uniref:sulfite exporter TauE/SafE family protein n=1 Tax=Sphaerisporangium sp. NPDC049003 TaxID=3364517 RepID=UPI00371E3DA6